MVHFIVLNRRLTSLILMRKFFSGFKVRYIYDLVYDSRSVK